MSLQQHPSAIPPQATAYNPALIDYLLFLADSNLILSQKNAAWCGHGPILEQDIAITNITLDLLGQARNFYQYAAGLINQATPSAANPATEDSLAYLRAEREFKNVLLVELPNGDWAQTILKLFFFSSYAQLLYSQLLRHTDATLAAIAAKSLKETNYHLRWSSEWVIRLGDGTQESRHRMQQALNTMWAFTGEMFMPAAFETVAAIDFTKLKADWDQKLDAILQEATLSLPLGNETTFMQTGGKLGIHTEHMGYILAEMQYLQRAYPNAAW